ncbi:hypothetical protein GCM10028822_43030 [Hymenobacter terrigena]
MHSPQPLFKPWAPEWLIRATLFLALVPSSILLALYGSTPADAAGFYGMEPSDVQFSILIYYAGLVAYFPFDPRFSSYLLSRQYFIWSLFLLILSVWLCTLTHQPYVLFGLRFFQGMVGAAIGSPCLTLIYSRLESKRARAMGYAVFYGALLAAAPLSTMVASLTLDRFDFPALFHVFILLQLPGALLLILLLNDVRLKRKMPLSQLEWPSFLYFAIVLGLFAYVMSYGQQLYWTQSWTVLLALLAMLIFGSLFVLRQFTLKRPYIDLRVLRYRNFRVGLVLFVFFYLCRGTAGIATSYFVGALRLDAWNLSYIQLATLAGTVAGIALTVRFVLVGTPMRNIWLVGFGLLLAYHVWMYFLFGPSRGPAEFLGPLFLQGAGTGTLFIPLIVYTLSALPPALGAAGSYAAVTVRFFTFSGSMALTGFFQLFWRSAHYDRFRQEAALDNPFLAARLQGYQQTLQGKGLAFEPAQKAAVRLLANAMEAQSQLRFSMGYYAMISAGIAALILALVVFPPVRNKVRYFRQRPLP